MLKFSQNLIKLSPKLSSKRQFWWYVNMMFNKVDQERVKKLGYERCTAEWLLRNGSCLKFINAREPLCDYNLLPPENTKFQIKEILADGAGISYIGFHHLKGCDKIDKIVLKNCGYIDDEAMKLLVLRKESLIHLEIIDCKNLTDEGLRSLKGLNLKSLTVKNLPYVKDPDGVVKELKDSLLNCEIDIQK